MENLGLGTVFFLVPLKRTSKVWDLCGLALLLADAILLPLSLAWDWHQGTDEPGSLFLLVVFLLSLLFWSVDICMNLNTAFYQRGFLVFSRWEILKHYLQTWCLDSIGYSIIMMFLRRRIAVSIKCQSTHIPGLTWLEPENTIKR